MGLYNEYLLRCGQFSPYDRLFGSEGPVRVIARRLTLGSVMKIYVSHVSEEDGLEIHHRFADQAPGLESPDCRIVGRPSIEALAIRTGSELNLQGSLTASV